MTLGVREHDGTVFYLHSGAPIFSHLSDDLIMFRFITSKLIFEVHYSIAKEEGISEGSIRYAIGLGRLKKTPGLK